MAVWKPETRRGVAAALLLCAVLLLSACGSSHSHPPYQVYLVTKSLDTQFWKSAIAGANAAKSEYNVDLTVVGPATEEDYEQQNDYIRQAVDAGADAVVLSAISYEGNAEAVDAAANAGLHIVVIDSDVNSDQVSVRIGTDNVQAGRMTGQAALNTEKDTLHVGIVNFDRGSRNGQERELGLREVLEADPRVQGIYTVNVPTSPESAAAGAEILLADHPDTNVLIGLNEPLALGVGLAVSRHGISADVDVIGFDTNIQCVDMLREGPISALIAQNPYAMGYLGIEYAWRLLEGERFDGEEWLDTSTTIVSRDNMFTPESQRALFSFG